jgi:hypothetical protein
MSKTSWLYIRRDRNQSSRPDGGLYIYNALAFSTLLSSQETDAHRCSELSFFARGDSFNLPGISFLSNRLLVRFARNRFAGFGISGFPEPSAYSPFGVVRTTHVAPRRLSTGGSPGPGPPSGVPSPSGQQEPYGSCPPSSNRSWHRVMPHPPRLQTSRIEAQPDPVQQPKPGVTAPLVRVGTGDRGPGQLDDTRPQRLRRERQRL